MGDNLNFDINVLIMFIVVGICIKLFFGGTTTSDGSDGPANAAIWSYGIIAFSVLSIMIITYALALGSQSSSAGVSPIAFFANVASASMPALSVLFVVIWLLTLNITYFTKINEGTVASEYYTYSQISTALLVFQLMLFFKSIVYDTNETKTPALVERSETMATMTYLFCVLNLVFIGMMTIILRFFSTDG